METERLQELAGLNENGLNTVSEESISKLSTRVFKTAEAMAFDEAQEGKRAVTGDMVHKHINHVLEELKKNAIKYLENEYKNKEK